MVSRDRLDYCLDLEVINKQDAKIRIEKFDGTYFGYCRRYKTNILYQKNLYQPLS